MRRCIAYSVGPGLPAISAISPFPLFPPILLFLLVLLSTGCPMVSEESVPQVTVGEIELSRHPTEPLHYRLSVAIHNGTEGIITSFMVDARAGADSSTETDPSGDAPVRLIRRCNISPGATPYMDIQFLSPFSVAPPHPLELRDIRFHSFHLDDGTTEPGEITVPFPVKEM